MEIHNTWKNKSGIYCIKNIKNNKCYVGSSKNIKNRLTNHKTQLLHQKHDNSYLQNAVNKHGLHSFICFVLEYCSLEDLISKEQYWINLQGHYNIVKEVQILKFTEYSKQKMSNTRKIRIAEGLIPKFGTKPIQKFSKDGVFIKEYPSITSAVIDCTISSDQIRRVLQQKHKTAGGFQWKYSNSDIIIEPYSGRDYSKSSKNLYKKVLMCDMETGIYTEFESVKDLAFYFNIAKPHASVISRNINKLYKKRYKIEIF